MQTCWERFYFKQGPSLGLQKALSIAEKALGQDHHLTKVFRKNLEIMTAEPGATK